MTRRTWRFEDVPVSFWARIEAAQGDGERFRASLAELSREELQEMFDQYLELVDQLFSSDHYDNDDTTSDIATWVVMQGREHYRNVRDNPDTAPRTRQLHGLSFASIISRDFRRRFGEPIG